MNFDHCGSSWSLCCRRHGKKSPQQDAFLLGSESARMDQGQPDARLPAVISPSAILTGRLQDEVAPVRGYSDASRVASTRHALPAPAQ